MIKKEFHKLLEKPMNRKEFLAHLGAGALTIMGISGLIKGMLSFGDRPTRAANTGYGSSAYGGRKRG